MKKTNDFRVINASEMPMGVRESLESMESNMSLPVVASVTPVIGALATHVKVSIHSQWSNLNLCSYIVGNAASGKGLIDNLIKIWLKEIQEQDDIYHATEIEYLRKRRSGEKNLEEPKLPIRIIPLNSSVANLVERLANTDGIHSFSFTPEADIVSQKWRSPNGDFSVMLRQAYDGSEFDREARSVNAVSAHIKRLLWNIVMCGTPDALYRLVNNYTNGLLTRIAIFCTPDNTFEPLPENPYRMTDQQSNRIQQVAHLLPFMNGNLQLDGLEKTSREWLEKIRLLSSKDYDRAMATQRMRICVTAYRMVVSLMLCSVAEKLISVHGPLGAVDVIKDNAGLLQQMMTDEQTDIMMHTYDILADEMLNNVLSFFRSHIEKAHTSFPLLKGRDRIGKNDTVFDLLPRDFNVEDAITIKGGTLNSVNMMFRNWLHQGLIIRTANGYQKCN